MKGGCICLFLLLVFSCLAIAYSEEEANLTNRLGWSTTLSYGDWTDMWPTVMKISDGYLVTGLSHRKKDKESYERKMVLWKLDTHGKELWVKDMNLPGVAADRPFVPERCFSLQEEPTLLLVSASTRKARLLRFNEAGTVTFSKELPFQQIFDIQGMRKTVDGFLLYGSKHKGRQNSDARVAKLDLNGNEIWHREYDKGKMEWGMGLALKRDGRFILSADSGNYNKFGAGPSEAWIFQCDPNGNILCETTFEGRHPTVTINGDITAVVFNKADFPQQDMAVVGLGEDLKTVWRIDSLFGKAGGLGMLRSIVNRQGNFVLAGNKFLAAELWEISKDGNILGEMAIQDANSCIRFESLIQTSTTGYLVAGHISRMSKMPRTPDGQRDENKPWDTTDILVTEVAMAHRSEGFQRQVLK